jgi:glucose/arabinose dehydrogenase
MGKFVPLFATIALALLTSVGTLAVLPVGPARGTTTLPGGFTDSPVVGGLTSPTDMEFAPDGRLFVAAQAGKLYVVKSDGTLAKFLDISSKVDTTGERGLSALTFDPNFSTNHYVYLDYTKEATTSAPAHNRVVRVTANGNRAVVGSEKLIFRLSNQDNTRHIGGALDFGRHGKLFVSTGDNVRGKVAQSIGNLLGKLLRINRDGTIPTGNPFYDKALGKNRAIWARGLRNPFKFAVRPGSGTIFINDVGESNWEEINRGAAGANFGWPVHEGVANDPNFADPIFAYGHDGDPASTGCAITGGAFYDPATLRFPAKRYEGDYFFAELCSGWIRVLDPSTGGVRGFAAGLENPVDLEVGQNGDLYYLARGATPSVGKIRYTGT